MIKLVVNKKPVNLHEVLTIEQWQAIAQWDLDVPETWINIIATATGHDIDPLRLMSFEERRLAVTAITQSLMVRKSVPLPQFESITFGQFVDVEYYLSQGLQKAIDNIVERLEIEANNAPEALWAVEQYIKWRTNLYKRYGALFNSEDIDEVDPAETKKWTPEHIAKSWYRIMVDLCNDNLLDMDLLTDKSVIAVLNFMAVRKEKQQEELKRLKKQQNELQRSRR